MRDSLKWIVRTAIPAVAFVIGLGASQVFAQDTNTFREEIRHYQERIQTMKTLDTTAYQAEMEQVRVWLDEAEREIAEQDTAKLKNTTMRIGVYLEYVETASRRDKVLSEVTAEEEKLKALRAEYGRLDAEIAQLEAEQESLSKKLESLTQK